MCHFRGINFKNFPVHANFARKNYRKFNTIFTSRTKKVADRNIWIWRERKVQILKKKFPKTIFPCQLAFPYFSPLHSYPHIPTRATPKFTTFHKNTTYFRAHIPYNQNRATISMTGVKRKLEKIEEEKITWSEQQLNIWLILFRKWAE